MPKQKAKFVIILLFLAVALLVYGWYYVMQKVTAPQYEVSPPTNAATPSNIVGKAPAGQLIAGFPSGLVLAGGVVTDSVEGKSPDPGKKLLVTFYEIKAPLAQIYEAYVSYFKENRWEVLSEQQGEDQVYFFAVSPEKDGLNLAASINPTDGKVIVKADLSKKVISE